MDPQNPYQPPSADVSPQDQGGTDETSPFSPSGRFGRLSFIAWGAILGVTSNLISAVFGGTQMFVPEYDASGMPIPPDISGAALAVIGIVSLVFFVFYIIFSIRRCHDFNVSGWWNLLLVIPLANLIFMLFLWLKPGTEAANNYGPPRDTPGWEKVVGIIGVVLMATMFVLVIGGAVTAYMAAMSAGG
jgi:uncharacterized membrane protein YhaH (DUF805 family)